MNKRLMALSLVVSLGFSHMPMQAAWLDRLIAPEKVECFQNAAMNYVQEASKIVQENPVACAVAGSAAILGITYLVYKYRNSKKLHAAEKAYDGSKGIVSLKDKSPTKKVSAFAFVEVKLRATVKNFLDDVKKFGNIKCQLFCKKTEFSVGGFKVILIYDTNDPEMLQLQLLGQSNFGGISTYKIINNDQACNSIIQLIKTDLHI